jgi:hypothetical protein
MNVFFGLFAMHGLRKFLRGRHPDKARIRRVSGEFLVLADQCRWKAGQPQPCRNICRYRFAQACIKKNCQPPSAMPTDGAIPFLIDWGATVRPSTVAPSAGRLTGLVIQHPEPGRVCNAMSALGAEVQVAEGSEFRLSAEIATNNGPVILSQACVNAQFEQGLGITE